MPPFWHNWFRRRGDGPIRVGRATEAAIGLPDTLSPRRSRTTDALQQLRRMPTESDALLFLRQNNPDVSMSVWNFVRLANLGNEMEIYDLSKKSRLRDVEREWRDFASRVNAISNAGLDGLIDQLHQSAFLLGAQSVEVEVSRDRTDIVDVYPIRPQTIEWKIEKSEDGSKRFVPYQRQGFNLVSLENANFIWVPTDPDIDDPRGTLIMASAIQAIDFQMQILSDLQQVIHNQGWPRYDIKVLLDRVLSTMPPHVKADPQKREDYLRAIIKQIGSDFRSLKPDDSFVHFDDVEVAMNLGANQGRSLDVRAITEMVDQQSLSGTKQLSVFMNRNTGVTETWGTVQFRIFASGIESIQRGSKRLIEDVARLWLRVRGIQGIPVFRHNVIDWNSEEQRWRVKLMQEEFYAIAQLMGWIDADTAAQKAVEADRATGVPVESARVSFGVGGEGSAVSGSGEHSRSESKDGDALGNGGFGGLVDLKQAQDAGKAGGNKIRQLMLQRGGRI